MKKFISNTKTLVVALIGLIGGTIWAFKAQWEPEPLILLAISSIEIIAFVLLKGSTIEASNTHVLNTSTNQGNISVSVNVEGQSSSRKEGDKNDRTENQANNREAKIDFMKSRAKILFIDDDKNFNVVKILKDSGWKHAKSIVDVKSIDLPIVKDTHIHFVDINGVGKLLGLPHEGLDLALMIKQRYPDKKVIIYSANRNTNAFHEAWDACDFKLEKNALPNQFQNLVEQYSTDLYNSIK